MGLFNFLNSSSNPQPDFDRELQRILPQKPRDIAVYKKAFTHPAEQRFDAAGHAANYERLEFLGDALIGSVTAKYLFDQYTDANEGELTKMRSKIVSRHTLNQAGKNLKLSDFLNAKIPSHHQGKHINGNLFEALCGAIFTDLGHKNCRRFLIQNLLQPFADKESLKNNIISYKGLLLETAQKKGKPIEFKTCSSSSSPQNTFKSQVIVADQVVDQAEGSSKKKAEEAAAKKIQHSNKPPFAEE